MGKPEDNGQHPSRRRLEETAFCPADQVRLADEEKTHIEDCTVCAARIEALREQRAVFLEARPAGPFLDRVDERLAEGGRFRQGFDRRLRSLSPKILVPVAAGVLAAVLGMALFPALRGGRDAVPGKLHLDNRIVLRGGAVTLDLFVSREGRAARPADPDEPLRQGDVLRFGVRSDEAGYVTVANQDDRGRVSLYFPVPGDTPHRVEAGEQTLLPGSIILDDFIGEELLVLVISPSKIPEKTIRDALLRAYDAVGGDLGRMTDVDVEGRVAFRRIRKSAP